MKMTGISLTEMWTNLGSVMASFMFVWALVDKFLPPEFGTLMRTYIKKFKRLFYPYIQITFNEYQGDGFERSKAYKAIERYLDKSSSKQAKRLIARVAQDSDSIVLSMQDYEEVTDRFQGIKIWWASHKSIPERQSISFYPREDEKRHFTLTCHKMYREIITTKYLKHVLDEGKAITVNERQRKLYTNNKGDSWSGYRRRLWSHVVFEHPATFNTLAMDPKLKQDIIDDLITFSKAKEYYAKIGKAWKRGYLLYGPPGTGKSTMIAAMANLLGYDVYDLELTSVKDNTDLRKLLIDTSSKSVIVIEDIDCSLDLTGQREKKKEKKKDEGEKGGKDAVEEKMKKGLDENKSSQVTLAGLLNFIDGLWSACGGERIIVFTTNHVEKLDPALIRRGRMDKHIELSYCGFEAFKALVKNYLDIESHDLFPTIRQLLEETKITPADVAENLMPKTSEDNADICLERLMKGIEAAKEEARLKAEEEERQKKAEEEERQKKAEEEEKEKKKEDKEGSSSSSDDGANIRESSSAKEVKENGLINH